MPARWRLPFMLLALLTLLAPGCASKKAAPTAAGPEVFDDAAQKFRAGDYAGAAEGFAKAAEESPDNAEAYYFLGLSRQKELFGKAAQAYRKALSLDSANAASMEALGLLYFSIGEFGEARTWLEKAAAAGGKNAEAALCLGEILYLDGQCREALAAYEKAASLDPRLTAAARRIIVANRTCGKGKDAKPAGEPASAPAPSQAPEKPAPKVIDLNDI